MKTWMQELVVRSKTRKSIVQTVTSQDKFQSPKIKKNRCAAGRTVKVKTCCEALTFDKVGREKGLK